MARKTATRKKSAKSAAKKVASASKKSSSRKSAATRLPKGPIWQWSAVDTAAAIRSGAASAVEVVQAHIDRMRAINPKLNAVVVDLSDDALEGGKSRRQCAGAKGRAWRAARRPDHDQGERRLQGPAQSQRRAGADEPHRAVGLAGRAQSQEGRRDRHRPDQHAGILVSRFHRQSAARADAESVGSRDHLRRLVGRRRRVGRSRHRHHRAWQRHRRLAALAGALQRHRDHQADPGPHPRL